MTLACEDGNSKLVEVVAVVDVDDKILKLLGSGPDRVRKTLSARQQC